MAFINGGDPILTTYPSWWWSSKYFGSLGFWGYLGEEIIYPLIFRDYFINRQQQPSGIPGFDWCSRFSRTSEFRSLSLGHFLLNRGSGGQNVDSRVLLAEVRESEDWSPVTNSRSLGTAWVSEKLRGSCGWSRWVELGWVLGWRGNKQAHNGRFFWKTRVGEGGRKGKMIWFQWYYYNVIELILTIDMNIWYICIYFNIYIFIYESCEYSIHIVHDMEFWNLDHRLVSMHYNSSVIILVTLIFGMFMLEPDFKGILTAPPKNTPQE